MAEALPVSGEADGSLAGLTSKIQPVTGTQASASDNSMGMASESAERDGEGREFKKKALIGFIKPQTKGFASKTTKGHGKEGLTAKMVQKEKLLVPVVEGSFFILL